MKIPFLDLGAAYRELKPEIERGCITRARKWLVHPWPRGRSV